MEYNTIEAQLNRKLNQRTITPSENIWSRIKGRQSAKRKKPVKWMVAAAVVAMLGIFQQIPSDSATDIIIVKEIPITTRQLPELQVNEQPLSVIRQRETKVTQPKPIQSLPIKPIEVAEVSIAISTDTFEVDNLAIKEKSIPVDYSSAESLLEAAQQELAENRIDVTSSARTAELLKEAEDGVNESFKEKVFDLFKHKFKTIKIALKDE